MGMEGYFLTLEIDTSLTNDEMKNILQKECKISKYLIPTGKIFRRYISDNSRFVIDNKAIVNIISSENSTRITFELCFSNYENNLIYIYNICKMICKLEDYVKLIILNNQYNFNILECEEFKKIVMKAYVKKFNEFKKKYGELKINILPHNFYDLGQKFNIHREKTN